MILAMGLLVGHHRDFASVLAGPLTIQPRRDSRISLARNRATSKV